MIIGYSRNFGPAPKAIDGFATGGANNASSGTVTLTTTHSNDVIVLTIHSDNVGTPTPTISSVTSPNLSWTRRTTQNWIDVGGFGIYNLMEVWWAPAASPLSSEVITVNITNRATDNATSLIAFGVSGSASYTTPWDANGSVPAFASNPGQNSPAAINASGLSTNSASPMVLTFLGTAVNMPTDPSGFTSIATKDQTGFKHSASDDSYENPGTALSSASVTSGSGNGGMIVDALA